MAYSEEIETRIKQIVSEWKNTDDKKMFGGVCHLFNGNMFCGVHKEFLILRLGKEKAQEALRLPHTRPFDMTGKPMQGWVMVAEDGFKSDSELKEWLDQAVNFVKTLPPK
jgi:TfoX/Sxy family transcriptional regulator of competence genes